jgi:hypothetical protein
MAYIGIYRIPLPLYEYKSTEVSENSAVIDIYGIIEIIFTMNNQKCNERALVAKD